VYGSSSSAIDSLFEITKRPYAPGERLELEARQDVSLENHRSPQCAAVAREIEATGIEPTPDLLAKLSRKERHYGVNGFVVAAHIARAWKRIAAHPSNHPRGPGWILKVVEQELAFASERREGPSLSDAARTARRLQEVEAAGRYTQLKADEAQHFPGNQAPPVIAPPPLVPTARRCADCEGDGIRQAAGDRQMVEWCGCPAGARKQSEEPDAVDRTNAIVFKLRQRFPPSMEPLGPKSGRSATQPRGSSGKTDHMGLKRVGDVISAELIAVANA
jgi:hypothetical protein